MSENLVIDINNAGIYQGKSLVLKNVNLKIAKGEFVYLLGKTGSGKSSLLKTLYADIPFTQGTASVAGYDLSTLKNKDIPFLRRKLGIVFQDFQLLSDRTVGDNLRFVMKATGWNDEAKIKNRITELLTKVGLANKVNVMPFELSGGEQQRISVARALINDPELILADEPTGNLDPETSAEVMQLLLEISKSGRSVLFATHDILLYNKFPSRTLKCEAGEITQI